MVKKILLLAGALALAGCLTEERQQGMATLNQVEGASWATSNAAVAVVSAVQTSLPAIQADVHQVCVEAVVTMRALRGRDAADQPLPWYRRSWVWITAAIVACPLIVLTFLTRKTWLDILCIAGKHMNSFARELREKPTNRR